MPILDAALAYALTMLVVATAVTQLVRLAQHFLGRRGSEFRKMLDEFYTGELKPVVQRELDRLQARAGDAMTEEILHAAARVSDAQTLFTKDEMARLAWASTEEIRERLKRSELGNTMLQQLGDRAETVFNELGRRYEVVGERFT